VQPTPVRGAKRAYSIEIQSCANLKPINSVQERIASKASGTKEGGVPIQGQNTNSDGATPCAETVWLCEFCIKASRNGKYSALFMGEVGRLYRYQEH
jgi:hypothetical protein